MGTRTPKSFPKVTVDTVGGCGSVVSFAPDAMPSMQERRSESGAAAGRLSAVKRHLAANPMDKPDIGAPAEAFDRDRMAQEAIPHIIWSVSQEGARRPLITKAEENWGTVTRGNPPGHLLPADALPAARLTPETWRVEIAADPYIEPPHVRVPAEVDTAVTLDYQGLRALGELHGTVSVLKSMQCLNVDTPLGQGVWQGVPLATVLRQCGQIDHCRRVYYWGWHNDDPEQVFRSSLSYTEVFESIPGEPPVFLAFALNGEPIPVGRGGPVRMIVPFGHGFKSVKFLQHIRLTNDYRQNDTYAAIAGGDEGNDPTSVQKTYTTVDKARGAPAVGVGEAVRFSGVLTSGRTPASHLEYWVRGPAPEFSDFAQIDPVHPEFKSAPWVRFELPRAPPLASVLPPTVNPTEIFGVGQDGVPSRWPLPFSYVPWETEIRLGKPGCYEIWARSVDTAGYAQPEPRPHQKNGKNAVEFRQVRVA